MKIQGKTAYWGNHTFEVVECDGKTRIDVYRNCTKIYETSFFVKNKKEILKLSQDENSSLRFYTGDLGGSRTISKYKPGLKYDGHETVNTLEYFLSCFKH
jgi:hypothetical protein